MATPSVRDGSRVRSALAGTGLAALGVVVASIMTLPVVAVDPAVLDPAESADRSLQIVALVLNFAGFAVAGALYLAVTGRGWSYVDLRWPTRRGWAYVLGGSLGSVLFIVAVSLVVGLLDLPSSSNSVVDLIGDDTTLLLAVIVIVFVANAPAEEFLFRNVIQKRLYEAFSKPAAVVVTSLIFALVHVSSFFAEGTAPEAAAVSLTVVFGGSVIFGWLYAKTDNLVVPIAAHSALNAFQFGILYLQLEYGDPEQVEMALSVVPL